MSRGKIIGISQNRDLAGTPHVWEIIDDERAECHMPEDRKLILRRTVSGSWRLSGIRDHRMQFEADSLENAIGTIIYRKFAQHPMRRVRASEVARTLSGTVSIPAGSHAQAHPPPNVILVPSQSDENTHYLVNLDEKSCNCPDHHYRKVICKHLMAVMDLLP